GYLLLLFVISFSALPRRTLLVWRPRPVAIEVQPSRKATARHAIAATYPQQLNSSTSPGTWRELLRPQLLLSVFQRFCFSVFLFWLIAPTLDRASARRNFYRVHLSFLSIALRRERHCEDCRENPRLGPTARLARPALPDPNPQSR